MAQKLRADRKTFDDMETRALVERLARMLKFPPPSFVAEQIRYRAYSYLERLSHDPAQWSRSELVLKEMPMAQWKLCLEKDPLLWIFMDQRPEAFIHFWASMSLHYVECSPIEDSVEQLMRQLNDETKGIPELLCAVLEQDLEKTWRKDRDSLADLLSREAGGRWAVVTQLRNGMITSASRIARQGSVATGSANVSFLKDMHILAQRLATAVVMAPLNTLFRVMCILTLCAHTADFYLDSMDTEGLRLACSIQAICLDAWHHCLVRRYEPRRPQLPQSLSRATLNSVQFQGLFDVRRSIIFAMVFVVDLLPRFDHNTIPASINDADTLSASEIFLREVIQALIPVLETALDWEQAAVAESEVISGSPTEANVDQLNRHKNTMFTHWLASLLIRQWTNESGLWDGTKLQIVAERFQDLVSQLQHQSSFSTSSIWQYFDIP
ncbi:hypothetical protein DFQ26_008282 [Actinomortierella ambigua]|nr:hypothetical protein DFQ26_008282 [Actinomortierella ambigua]